MFGKKEKRVVLYIVDDDELHLKIIESKIKSSSNYELRLFHSGEQFLNDINVNPIPKKDIVIVILDYYLKARDDNNAKNGIDILKILKETYPWIEVIMLSSSDDIDVATSSMHYGAITYIKKNENSFARIMSNVQWIISRKNLEATKRKHRITRQLFLFVLAIIITVTIIYFLKF